MRFRVTWNGIVQKTIAIETPADALYHVWSRYRDDFAGGAIQVGVDEGGKGVRLAQLVFPVVIRREIEAENEQEAVRSFLYDDRVPSLVLVQDIECEPAGDVEIPPDLEVGEPAEIPAGIERAGPGRASWRASNNPGIVSGDAAAE